jgi:hypothetical protein
MRPELACWRVGEQTSSMNLAQCEKREDQRRERA